LRNTVIRIELKTSFPCGSGETIKKIRGHSNAISPRERERERGEGARQREEGDGLYELVVLPNYDGIKEHLESQLT